MSIYSNLKQFVIVLICMYKTYNIYLLSLDLCRYSHVLFIQSSIIGLFHDTHVLCRNHLDTVSVKCLINPRVSLIQPPRERGGFPHKSIFSYSEDPFCFSFLALTPRVGVCVTRSPTLPPPHSLPSSLPPRESLSSPRDRRCPPASYPSSRL